jgi:hypothetical protein
MKWQIIQKTESRKTNSLGAILRNGIFGKTAHPAISIFPQGIASKPHQEKMCLCGQSELNGDNFIVGVAAAESDGLQDGEIMIFSENANKEKKAKVILRVNGDIEITGNNITADVKKIVVKSPESVLVGENGKRLMTEDFIDEYKSHNHEYVQPPATAPATTTFLTGATVIKENFITKIQKSE